MSSKTICFSINVVIFSHDHLWCKDTANREKYKISLLIFISECSVSSLKILQIERNTRLRPTGSNLQSLLIFISECSVSSLKILQIERNTRLRPTGSNLQSLLIFISECSVSSIFYLHQLKEGRHSCRPKPAMLIKKVCISNAGRQECRPSLLLMKLIEE